MADRARDPDALEREIERTRLELARNIDELAERVNPKNVAQRGADRLKEEAGQVVKAARAMVGPAGDEDDTPGVDRRLLIAGAGVAVGLTALVLWRRSRRR